ncbi:MAG: hypothetical protein ACOZB0_07255 [Pseudomonadota bacterium]
MAEAINSLIGDDPASVLSTGPVVIYAPAGRHRKRFPENCVTAYANELEARTAAKPELGYHAAIASGPSRSSEGFRLYYLLRWLD